MYRIIAVLALIAIQGCSTTYVAQERTLEEGRIAAFPVSGEVVVENSYADEERVELRPKHFANLKQVTDVFVGQLRSEIQRNGQLSAAGQGKTIKATVRNMNLANRRAYMEGQINVRLELGNGEVITFERRDGHPMSDARALNSVIARAVMETLEHPKVLAYLAE